MEEQAIVSAYRRSQWIKLIAWTALVTIAALFYHHEHSKEIIELAKNTAKTALNKDLATREWIISHGGVYVPINDRTPSSPWLSHVPEQDIQTPSKKSLTLMNSSYVLRQMMESYGTLYGEKTRISSLKPLNPGNMANDWEKKALRYFQTNPTKTYFYELHQSNEGEYIRMMIPMFVEKSCLKCHNPLENKIGDIRGGISISVPLKAFIDMTKQALINAYIWFTLIWLVVCAAIIAASKAMEKKSIQLHATEREKIKNYQSMISLIIDLIDKRDSYTAGHSQRVSHYCEIITRAMYHDESLVNKIKEAAVLHDVGKIAIPDSILLKPEKLTPTEKELINYHLTAGYDLLSKVDMYKELAEIIRYHHERYDGAGYPQGVSGKQIPPLARIMIVADAFDAMTTDRIYKPRKSVDEALKELELHKGSQFDPDVIDIATAVLKDITINAAEQFPKTSLEEERFAYYLKDQLTGLNNHWALESILKINQHTFEYRFATVITLENLMVFNRANGWHNGNILIETFSDLLKNRYQHYHIYRIFGDTFIILSQEYLDLSATIPIATKFLEEKNITLSITVIHLIEEKIDSINKLEEIINSQQSSTL
ncbi:HD domain-containing phosphohydrolase [Sulfuricurvum sp.]|uniref:HD domain-containing phosphohydrolase n=1 Tax=Sulfuricurvum sp. TaxID=2025608 RepID=UPI003C49FE42